MTMTLDDYAVADADAVRAVQCDPADDVRFWDDERATRRAMPRYA